MARSSEGKPAGHGSADASRSACFVWRVYVILAACTLLANVGVAIGARDSARIQRHLEGHPERAAQVHPEHVAVDEEAWLALQRAIDERDPRSVEALIEAVDSWLAEALGESEIVGIGGGSGGRR